MEKDKFNFERKNLVVLMYATNNCYPKVVNLEDAEKENSFNVNCSEGKWSYRCWKDVKIGQSRNPYDNFSYKPKDGIIGVYDRLNTNHLNSLAHDAKEFTSSDSYAFNDYL